MPFTSSGADISMRRNPATGRLDFDWDATGNPKFDDSNGHRVMSLLIEHRPSPATPSAAASPGYWADATGKRGSLLYTVKNVLRETTSQVEAYAIDALQKATAEGWFTSPVAKAFLRPVSRARLDVTWTNPGARPQSTSIALSG